MTISVRIPTPLRKFTTGQDIVDVEGNTVGAALSDLNQKYPGLQDRLYDENGKIRRFVNIFANDEDIRFLDGQDTELAQGDEISIIPAIAGGR